MKIISRRENQGLVIGDDIQVTVLEVGERHVRLAITAPGRDPEYREETLYCQPAAEHAELALSVQL
jgi:carbon storage regulator CsrA